MSVLAEAAGFLIHFIGAFIINKASHDEKQPIVNSLGDFTTNLVHELRARYPGLNIMVCRGPYSRNLVGEQMLHAEVPVPGDHEAPFEWDVFLFKRGHFEKQGMLGVPIAGGYAEWCFEGNFVRDGFKVEFEDITVGFTPPNPLIVPHPLTVPPPPTGPAPPPTDGVFLVNSEKDGVWTSGLAWCGSISTRKDGEMPDAYIDIPGHGPEDGNGTVTWEGNYTSGIFPDGNIFWAVVGLYAHRESQPLYSVCGSANNSYRKFQVRKDRWRVLYEVDGWKVYTLYYCQ